MAKIDTTNLGKFTQSYALSNFGITTDTTVAVGSTDDDFIKIGSFEVDAQTLATFGAGAIANGVDFRETWKMDLNSAAATPIVGLRIRLEITNKKSTRTRTVKEELCQNLVAGVKLGEYPLKANEDDRLVIKAMNPTAGPITIDVSESTMSLPITTLQ